MQWIQVITIIGTIVGFGWYFLSCLEKDIDKVDRRMDGHAQRIDKLYQMFVDLLKERK